MDCFVVLFSFFTVIVLFCLKQFFRALHRFALVGDLSFTVDLVGVPVGVVVGNSVGAFVVGSVVGDLVGALGIHFEPNNRHRDETIDITNHVRFVVSHHHQRCLFDRKTILVVVLQLLLSKNGDWGVVCLVPLPPPAQLLWPPPHRVKRWY
jgi:hypothetical protein